VLRRILPGPTGPLDGDGLDGALDLPGDRSVRVNFALTVDGGVELEGRSGGIGGDADRVLFSHLRSMADVVVVGAGTARTERYGGVRLDAAALARRAARSQAPGVPVAVVTGRADLDPTARLFSDTVSSAVRPLVLTSAAAPAAARAALAAVADVVVCGDAAVEPAVALAALGERGLHHVLCEGGPSLLASWVHAGAVDELCLSLAPLLAGAGHGALLPAAPDRPLRMTLRSALTDDEGTIFARYRMTTEDRTAPAGREEFR
jgi:riboflavin biosynthesis pyrimidine reductase